MSHPESVGRWSLSCGLPDCTVSTRLYVSVMLRSSVEGPRCRLLCGVWLG